VPLYLTPSHPSGEGGQRPSEGAIEGHSKFFQSFRDGGVVRAMLAKRTKCVIAIMRTTTKSSLSSIHCLPVASDGEPEISGFGESGANMLH